ncbi:MAG: hypothetical protein M1816_004305 [Peltula sp. TS41687]|nr:MAG: hypothetical protein M1816_004305 [Peltula sp. TS41687]
MHQANLSYPDSLYRRLLPRAKSTICVEGLVRATATFPQTADIFLRIKRREAEREAERKSQTKDTDTDNTFSLLPAAMKNTRNEFTGRLGAARNLVGSVLNKVGGASSTPIGPIGAPHMPVGAIPG